MKENKFAITARKWLVSIRPFALPASTMPVVYGTALAVVMGGAEFRPFGFALALISMVLLHCGANILSDINDYDRGLDREPTPVSGGVVRKIITKREAIAATAVLFSTGSLIGLYLAWTSGILLLYIGMAGVLIGILYTEGGPVALKYHALGDAAVFMNFGILGSLGAWIVQTGDFSWVPVVWAVPMALLVIGILHANNWRDIESDTAGKIRTVASIMGDRVSLAYYFFLLFFPFAAVLVYMFFPGVLPVALPRMPYTFAVIFLSLPMAVKLFRKALRRKTSHNPMDFIALDGATARFNLVFGALCTLSLLIYGIGGIG